MRPVITIADSLSPAIRTDIGILICPLARTPLAHAQSPATETTAHLPQHSPPADRTIAPHKPNSLRPLC